MELRKEFVFESAHRLPNVPEGHKCGRTHGHSYRVVVCLEGSRDPQMGWIVDFGEVKAEWNRVADISLDHRFLNDIPGLANPTAENLCWWLFERLWGRFPELSRIEVWETATSMAALERKEFIDWDGIEKLRQAANAMKAKVVQP